MAGWGYRNSKYKSQAEKKEQAAKNLAKLQKKNPNMTPIIIEGRKIAKTWWGVAWNDNLERYADFANRIDRGRSYVRQGAVLDLQIYPGEIAALVQGSRKQPYQVRVVIDPLPPAAISAVTAACTGNIHSLQELIDGKFPQSMSDLFTSDKNGLFPSPREIHFGCNCPDWADLCKHVAAVLYGIGARLDQDPTLFFVLRQIKMDDLITRTIEATAQQAIQKTVRKSGRVLANEDLSGLFDLNIAGLDSGHTDEANSMPVPETVQPASPKAEPAKAKRGVDLICEICGKPFSKTTIARHLVKCQTEKNESASIGTEQGFLLKVEGADDKRYCLILQARKTATLADLDKFLRKIWLECCGHLSQFMISRYELDMDMRLDEVFSESQELMYDYDSGSTTTLKIKVLNAGPIAKQKRKITLLARNVDLGILCSRCGRPATVICTACQFEHGTPGFLCGDCVKTHECDEDYQLPVVNSPRMGVCAYTGQD